MVHLNAPTLARGQTIIYGVKRGKVPTALRPVALHQRKSFGKASCLEEIRNLSNCWKSSGFEDERCNKQIEEFLKCAQVAYANREEILKSKPKDKYGEINKLLRQYTTWVGKRTERKF